VKGFEPYAANLAALAARATSGSVDLDTTEAITAALDADAAERLRSSVSRADRRAVGAFFTSPALAERAWAQLATTLDTDSVVLDPACGAGSLLLPALPNLAKLSHSASDLGRRLHGFDLSQTFVSAARSRLSLTALAEMSSRDGYGSPTPDLFSYIRKRDLFKATREDFQGITHVAINPPYTMLATPDWCTWSSGKVNAAALMVSFCLDRMQPGARMIAILPDVLKSGSRYTRWRDDIESRFNVEDVTSVGQFDQQTDVHVFLLQLSVPRSTSAALRTKNASGFLPRTPSTGNQRAATANTNKLGDYFKVSVGAVVQHRHPESGPARPFAEAKTLEPRVEVSDLSRRRFSGRCEEPPFVLIRRTSRPGEPTRARPALVVGADPVAVDNHLIVAKPLSGTVVDCERLVRHLHDPATSAWLDENFRCRHLTVGSLKSLPIGEFDSSWPTVEGEVR